MSEQCKTQTATAEEAPKRGRGRPKGSKNKPKTEQVAQTPAIATETKAE